MEKNVVYFKCVAVFGYSPNINKRGGDKGVGPVLAGVPVEGVGIGDLEYWNEDIEDSSFEVTLVPEVVSDGDFSGGILYLNEELDGLTMIVSLVTVVLSKIVIYYYPLD